MVYQKFKWIKNSNELKNLFDVKCLAGLKMVDQKKKDSLVSSESLCVIMFFNAYLL